MKTFADNLKSKRLEYGWSQERAAQKISAKLGKPVDKSTYQAWEKGRRTPRMDMLVTIAEVFRIDNLLLFISIRN